MVQGQFITINGDRFYEIANYDEMQPFFISLASDTDLWMYLSSTGGLTCGRRSPGEALFPYYTDDKITESYEHTGPKSIFRVNGRLWEPFSDRQQGVYELSRKIAKSTVGNQIVFCEENHTLGLRFSYLWAPANKHGWVRRATLENLGEAPCAVEILDGLQNILPAGVERKTQNEFSTLVDGYKKTELIVVESQKSKVKSGLGLFRMEAILVDRAEPSESLTCNTVYALGLHDAQYFVSSECVKAFRKNEELHPETESKGVRGAFFAHVMIERFADSLTWYNVLDVSQDAVAVHELMHFIAEPDAAEQIEAAMQHSTDKLRQIVAQNDGVQETGDEANDARHFANVLYNTMRGGYYLTYPPKPDEDELPLTFGRRHGDPSRPWNMFNIRVQDEQGNPIVAYQGNWRDIFQNWEALSYSYPLFINHIIAKFLNATTADGYNPYRISNEGIDYEVIEPENPWSNIGYWGDHQIIYLLKLLELSDKHDPEQLRALLNERHYAFANVPYRLKSYAEIVADPKNSIRFDDAEHKRIQALIPELGADAKLLLDGNRQVRRTTMVDKLLITLLTKLSNLIPEAGIWMNTLRPEWNDANNALVGYGASMVTLCYMRRYVSFLQQLIQTDITIGQETRLFLQGIRQAYGQNRRAFTDTVGQAGEAYRARVYKGISGEQTIVTKDDVQAFLADTLNIIDRSIRANKREDGLYEAYNLIRFTDKDIEIEHLYPMLEGQVAVLTSGLLSAKESEKLLEVMMKSSLYREDQHSYMLYPNRRRAGFLEMNNLPDEAKTLPVVQKYLGTILKEDRDGGIHFDAKYRNANDLPEDLKELYESVFHHHAFTGRSGTFYKYEGLGCIYWHMVSKLLLAVGEVLQRTDANDKAVPLLLSHYLFIRAGIGSHKRPDEYGAFPFDPYSHTPTMTGVQQPGMTGQVKEDIISRWFELGVHVHDGQISFCPPLIIPDDYVDGELRFTYCGTLVVYHLKIEGKPLEAYMNSNKVSLTKEQSAHIFARDGQIKQLDIQICVK